LKEIYFQGEKGIGFYRNEIENFLKYNYVILNFEMSHSNIYGASIENILSRNFYLPHSIFYNFILNFDFNFIFFIE
jgi:hypothetical protein